MSKPLVVSIPHRLGKDEALRRLKNGLGSASANFGHVFKIQEEIWTGLHLQYRISALGQVASGSIDVAEDCVRLEVFLPWLLAKLAETLQPRKELCYWKRNKATKLISGERTVVAGDEECFRPSLR